MEPRYQLAEHRKKVGLSQHELAEKMGVSRNTPSRWERGESEPSPQQRKGLASELGVSLARLDRILRNEDNGDDHEDEETSTEVARLLPEWLTAYVGQEQSASRIQAYESNVVNGLLQTSDYTKVLASESDYARGRADRVQKLVKLRLRRQAALTRETEPLHLDVVLSETALRTKVDGNQTMFHQLKYIVDRAELPNVSVRVLPFDAGYHNATRGSFMLLTFPWEATTEPITAYAESYNGGSYMESPHQINYFVSLYERLRDMSLSPNDSIKLIQQLAEEYV